MVRITDTQPGTLHLPDEAMPTITPWLHGGHCLTDEQRKTLVLDLPARRVSTRRESGRDLTYVEAWDIKAHLTRVFGFCGWDSEVVEYRCVFEREYLKPAQGDRPEVEMVEVCYTAKVALAVKCEHGETIAIYSEVAGGQANVAKANASRGDAHDNAIKQAESDALKRCAISLGTQFGLSLYNNGSREDVIKMTLVNGLPPTEPTPEQEANLANGLGVEVKGGEEADRASTEEQ